MGLTSALFAGLTGMKTNEFRMDVIGNNIANVNTYAFKSSRANFQTQFLNTLSFGSAPEGAFGGTNPLQIGTGSTVGAVTRDFSGGAPETTGNQSDLAIQGQGLFILNKPDGAQVYTRDGSFQFNAENYLLSADGYFLQGYGVDNDFNIDGQLGNIRIPLGEITTAATTTGATFSGDLNASGEAAIEDIATGGANGNVRTVLSTANTQVLTDNGAPNSLLETTLMINLQDDTGTSFVADGNEIVLSEAIKGDKNLPEETFDIGLTTTLGEFMTWLEGVLGINTTTDAAFPGFTNSPGVTLNGDHTGIDIVGNIGSYNVLSLGNSALKVQKGTGVEPSVSLPFTFSVADGFSQPDIESIRTSFRAYDSLGLPLNIDITLVMQSKGTASGITWRYFAECAEDSDSDRVVGTGTVKFDANGSFVEGTDLTISIDRDGTGAATPQSIELDFSTMDGFAMNDSAISLLSQNGFQAGTLQDYSISPDGIITGSFTNGLARNLGQVVLATFRNYEGLVADSDNIYITGPNSGDPIIKRAQELGAGTISSASLELSNVDLSREFINLIVSSTGFSASSRVIQTSDQLLSELMMLTR